MSQVIAISTCWADDLALFRDGNSNQYQPADHSTLNQHFNIQNGVAPAVGKVPQTSYLCIGRGGHKNVAGTGGASLMDTLMHKVTDARLFEHIPFAIRPIGDDLDIETRKKYRLRRIENFGGQDYFVYYMLKVDVTTSTPTRVVRDTTGGTVQDDNYVEHAGQLNPTPVTMVNGVPQTSSGKFLITSKPYTVILDQAAVAEIVNAMTIKHGDPRFARISEVAVCSGVDKVISVNDGGVSTTITEVIGAQVQNFVMADHNLVAANNGVKFDYKLGNMQPFYE